MTKFSASFFVVNGDFVIVAGSWSVFPVSYSFAFSFAFLAYSKSDKGR